MSIITDVLARRQIGPASARQPTAQETGLSFAPDNQQRSVYFWNGTSWVPAGPQPSLVLGGTFNAASPSASYLLPSGPTSANQTFYPPPSPPAAGPLPVPSAIQVVGGVLFVGANNILTPVIYTITDSSTGQTIGTVTVPCDGITPLQNQPFPIIVDPSEANRLVTTTSRIAVQVSAAAASGTIFATLSVQYGESTPTPTPGVVHPYIIPRTLVGPAASRPASPAPSQLGLIFIPTDLGTISIWTGVEWMPAAPSITIPFQGRFNLAAQTNKFIGYGFLSATKLCYPIPLTCKLVRLLGFVDLTAFGSVTLTIQRTNSLNVSTDVAVIPVTGSGIVNVSQALDIFAPFPDQFDLVASSAGVAGIIPITMVMEFLSS